MGASTIFRQTAHGAHTNGQTPYEALARDSYNRNASVPVGPVQVTSAAQLGVLLRFQGPGSGRTRNIRDNHHTQSGDVGRSGQRPMPFHKTSPPPMHPRRCQRLKRTDVSDRMPHRPATRGYFSPRTFARLRLAAGGTLAKAKPPQKARQPRWCNRVW